MENVFQKFATKSLSDLDDYSYYYEGKKINKDLTLMKLINNKSITDIDIITKRNSKSIKCPKCSNNSFLKIENYRLIFSECVNKHDEKRLFEEYEEAQNINLSKIKCDKNGCHKTQKDSYESFYKCLKCSSLAGCAKYYCPECSKDHSKDHKHKLIKYEEKYYYCIEHFNEYISYCKNCKKNLCNECEKNHKEHEIKKFEQIIPKVKHIKKNLEKIREKIEDLVDVVNEIKNKMDRAVQIIQKYYDISMDIIEKYEKYNTKFKNYQVLLSIEYLNYSNESIFNDIVKIIKGNASKDEWKKKCDKLIDIIENDRADYKNENKQENNTGGNINDFTPKNIIINNANNINNSNDNIEPISVNSKKEISIKNAKKSGFIKGRKHNNK